MQDKFDAQKLKNLQEKMDSYKTPQSGQQAPSFSEVKTQQDKLTTAAGIEALLSKSRAEQWYPDSNVDAQKSGGEPVPLLNKIIDTSLTGVYGIVGAVDYATGKSEKGSLGEAIDYNINDSKRTFGDVTGNAAIGLAGDIIFDPINWITAGTTALIPRIATGVYKGGAKAGIKGALRGAGSAAESRLLETALTTGKLAKGTLKLGSKAGSYLNPVRYIKKAKGVPISKTVTAESIDNVSNFTKWVQGRSISASKAFDETMGTTAIQRAVADKTPVGLMWRKGVQDLAERAVKKSPALAEYFDKYWKYSNADWTRVSQLRDSLLKTSGRELDEGMAAYVRSFKTGEDFETALAAIRPEFERIANTELVSLSDDIFLEAGGVKPTASVAEMQKVTSSLASEASEQSVVTLKSVVDQADEAAKIMDNPTPYITNDHIENGLRMAAEKGLIDRGNMSSVVDDLQAIIKRGDMGETGVEWWDGIRKTLRTYELKVKEANKQGMKAPMSARIGAKAEKTLDVYEALMALFKRAAVGASPTAWTNAIFGNLVMAKMVGIDVIDPAFMKSMVSADKIIGAKKGSELLLEEMFASEGILNMIRNNPTLFESTTGLSPVVTAKVMKARQLVEKTRKMGIDAGVLPVDITKTDTMVLMEDLIEQAGDSGIATRLNAVNDGVLDVALEHELSKQASKGASRRLLDSIGTDGKVGKVNTTDFATNELFNSTMANKWFSSLSKASKKDGNYAAKLGDAIFNGMPDAYGKLDYRYKVGAILYASKEGLKEGEMRIVQRMINLVDEDMTEVIVGGVKRFKLSSEKSLELANEAFLNYNAMPAMVRVLRNLPLVGAPFAAFTYGMYTKTAKTAFKNPAVFNKVNLALNEFSGEKTPIEKGLLEMDRYSYLDDPAMINLPGLGNNMVFLNLANMIPYYTLNMFQPPQRRYDGVLPNTLVQTMDRLPIMQDPTGSVIFDYFLLPYLLGEELPKGGFGQTLYPKDASFGKKSLYAARSLVDPYVPGIVQPFAGLATGIAENAGIVPEGTTQLLPGYRARSTGEAVQGNTSVGVNSKEPATQRTLRNLGSAAGISVQSPVPYSYLNLKEALRNNKNK